MDSDNKEALNVLLGQYVPDEIFDELTRTGCRKLSVRQDTEPKLPPDVHKMALPQLLELYQNYLGWYEYVMTLLMYYSVNVKCLEEELALVKAALLPTSGNPQEKNAMITRHPAYIEVNRKYIKAKALLDATELRERKIKEILNGLSRFMTAAMHEQDKSLRFT